ncbi:hypothetical protein ALP75_204834 [Pseudomonas syringae pv. actinidiae]|nr:hypothetical protein ALP75_204834 [Pseudomonas syringae pv. actinidiae]
MALIIRRTPAEAVHKAITIPIDSKPPLDCCNWSITGLTCSKACGGRTSSDCRRSHEKKSGRCRKPIKAIRNSRNGNNENSIW